MVVTKAVGKGWRLRLLPLWVRYGCLFVDMPLLAAFLVVGWLAAVEAVPSTSNARYGSDDSLWALYALVALPFCCVGCIVLYYRKKQRTQDQKYLMDTAAFKPPTLTPDTYKSDVVIDADPVPSTTYRPASYHPQFEPSSVVNAHPLLADRAPATNATAGSVRPASAPGTVPLTSFPPTPSSLIHRDSVPATPPPMGFRAAAPPPAGLAPAQMAPVGVPSPGVVQPAPPAAVYPSS